MPGHEGAGVVGGNGRLPGPSGCRLLGIGTAVPGTTVSNFEIETFLDTSDEWIQSRTGIRERRVAEPGLTLVALAARAARAALEAARLEATEIDSVICSSSSPDATFPSLACRLQAELGCPQGAAFDVQAACSGALYGIALAQSMIQTGLSRTVLVVAAEIFSRVLDWNDRSTAVLFGDGAGAFVVGPQGGKGAEIIALDLGADGGGAAALDTIRYRPPDQAPIKPLPQYATSSRALDRVVHMDGREVFRFSTKILEQIVLRLADAAGTEPNQIALFVPHQANSRILATAAGRLGVPFERFACNLERLGNTSSASIPLALAEADRLGRCHDGDLVCLVAFGAGLTWGGALLRWQPTGVVIDDPAERGSDLRLGGTQLPPELAHKEVSE
ncbi:MAG TPA: beta-ketoacyl-ACP synthase III [Candidatus Dormibacteraeota bacterium]|nr:beta-ketoacyl-ACP synthase III [Candidatus Dormibacteraeota bacterium]